jgi:hypothetical protein
VTLVKRQVYLILLGVGAMVLSLIVLARNRNIDVDLLAVLGLLGGVAMIVVALPGRNGNNAKH